MIELKHYRLEIIALGSGEGETTRLMFGAFNARNELLDVFEPAGTRWRRKPGESADDFEKRILKDLDAQAEAR